MSYVASCYNEFFLSFAATYNPPKNTPLDLRIVNLAITLFAPVTGLACLLSGGHLALFGINFFGNYIIRCLTTDYLILKVIDPSVGLDLKEDLLMVSELIISDNMLLGASLQLVQTLKITALVGSAFVACMAYKHYLHPDSYPQKV